MSFEGAPAGEGIAYSYQPSLLGAAWEFKLASDGIDWAAGRKGGQPAHRAGRATGPFRARQQSAAVLAGLIAYVGVTFGLALLVVRAF
jgi:hypothetical protein